MSEGDASGPGDVGQIHDQLVSQTASNPLLFTNFTNHWGAKDWSPAFFAQHPQLAQRQILFRVGRKSNSVAKRRRLDIEWENTSNYVSATFGDFFKYINGEGDGSLLSPSEHSWVYADYKYIKEVFDTCPQLIADVDWAPFGFNGRNGDSSTFWLGSPGAHTPCHYDTYGCNLVAQIYGKKTWTLFPPSETSYLYPTRVPFEESTVFSQVNIKDCDLNTFPLFTKAQKFVVTLEPGQVLYVPKHWWHFVECETTAISVNTWIELDSDGEDRIRETLSAMLTKGLVDYAGEINEHSIYNPKEVPMTYKEGMRLIEHLSTATPAHSKDKTIKHTLQDTFSLPCRCCTGHLAALSGVPVEMQRMNASEATQSAGKADDVIDLKKLLNCVTHPRVIQCMAELLR